MRTDTQDIPLSIPTQWEPTEFTDYKSLYPATPEFDKPHLVLNEEFAKIWYELRDSKAYRDSPRVSQFVSNCRNTTIVLIRGYLGNYMPGNMVAACRVFEGLGLEAFIVSNRTSAQMKENAERIGRQIKARVSSEQNLLFLGHSKGGIEAKFVLMAHPDLAVRTRGIIMSQTPRGPSAVLESLLLHQHQDSLSHFGRRLAEKLQRVGIYSMRARRSGFELTRDAIAEIVRLVDQSSHPVPTLQSASWSSRPTTWLDSFHQRLGEVRPGCAHDGQFYLEDLIWPDIPHVLLSHVDHAQPVVGGFGFDSSRYWLASALLFMDHFHPSQERIS